MNLNDMWTINILISLIILLFNPLLGSSSWIEVPGSPFIGPNTDANLGKVVHFYDQTTLFTSEFSVGPDIEMGYTFEYNETDDSWPYTTFEPTISGIQAFFNAIDSVDGYMVAAAYRANNYDGRIYYYEKVGDSFVGQEVFESVSNLKFFGSSVAILSNIPHPILLVGSIEAKIHWFYNSAESWTRNSDTAPVSKFGESFIECQDSLGLCVFGTGDSTAIYVYEVDGSGYNITLVQTIDESNTNFGQRDGSTYGDWLVVGGYGKAFFYKHNGTEYLHTQTVSGSCGSSSFGLGSISMTQNMVAISCISNRRVLIYSLGGDDVWQFTKQIQNSVTNSNFGNGLSFSKYDTEVLHLAIGTTVDYMYVYDYQFDCSNDIMYIPCENSPCVENGTTYTCGECDPGYQDIDDPYICGDINECQNETLNNCNPLRECVNEDGGYYCDVCPDNYVNNGPYECQDLCSYGESECKSQRECIFDFENGNYTCGDCPSGYVNFGDYDCQNVCTSGTSNCSYLRTCNFDMQTGEYTCGPCPMNYIEQGLYNCDNYCEADMDNCDERRDCIFNQELHTYSCGDCPSSYINDGEVGCFNFCQAKIDYCSELRDCVYNEISNYTCNNCPSNYINNGDYDCIDICESGEHGCPQYSHCLFENASFSCVCDNGYELISDECLLVCEVGYEREDGICMISCGEGYIRNEAKDDCLNICEADMDECSEARECIFGNENYTCGDCPDGYEAINDYECGKLVIVTNESEISGGGLMPGIELRDASLKMSQGDFVLISTIHIYLNLTI
eukprot:TRINITY_DN731_c0_g1_i3.p1 TRINITY_DN731_c0_g1~~TRINITY_DN731_c0_g1_i3.p1  ORF type:complete len:787 (-),score=140.71 TRINITY_DN731_c0_g1_i3:670-3030(-)